MAQKLRSKLGVFKPSGGKDPPVRAGWNLSCVFRLTRSSPLSISRIGIFQDYNNMIQFLHEVERRMKPGRKAWSWVYYRIAFLVGFVARYHLLLKFTWLGI
jgi:hypothetical protein